MTVPTAPGTVRVEPQPVVSAGRLYVGTAARPTVTVRSGVAATVAVTYAAAGVVRDLHVTDVGPSSVALAWTAPAGTTVKVRRVLLDGTSAPNGGQGTLLVTRGVTAVDEGLEPGRQYAYSLTERVAQGWTPPVTVVVGTPSGAADDATFVASPGTLLATAQDVVSAATTGDGVTVVLADQVTTPAPGTAVVLPVSDVLPGGFLGTVQEVGTDGRRLRLAAGGLADAFDYYALDVPDIAGGGDDGGGVAAAAAAAAPSSGQSGGQPPSREQREEAAARAAPAAAAAGAQVAAGAAVAAVGVDCDDASEASVEFSPSVSLGGRFSARVDKYRVLGVDVPTGASLDMELYADVTAAVAVATSRTVTCGLDLPDYERSLSAYPVPLAFVFTPTVEITVTGEVRIRDIGVSARAGFRVAGHFGATSGSSFTGSPVHHATPLTPVAEANGEVRLELGGDVLVGPGAASEDAGVVAGVGGELKPLDASFRPEFSVGHGRFDACVEASAALTLGVHVTAKAWLGSWSASRTVSPEALQRTFQYPGSPWHLPSGCDEAPAVDPGTTLLGPGVTKVGDSVGGSADQWGHVEGFVPGQKTWVLSTGVMAHAVGAPGDFASTGLGAPGDEMLSAMSGRPTYDAAYYQVTLVPTGDTLHVRYVFASEEYPEYVGSPFNDVMGVFVDGVNCATVPGTSTPVSVNTVNPWSHADHYVDNQNGAAGYATSMDGLTVPLTCSVPVTPGQPVTVRIAAADSSDSILDSAVALVDGGIWTD
ncbi:choice-of-anchor L domain-containing protein [Geodermatophilus saharensis]|uniref:choice-of-anchor L domain-containing protein n=1 Tax=Geodermatophilus saharensis TaxID=1137994 RepID=UPI000B772E9C|nr:choice-of-anchor L domain-containing protein [Geodermatophilus saharensis]